MNKVFYRPLTEEEEKRAAEQPGKRTIAEKYAYLWLPESMKCNIEKAPPIAFADEKKAYFPDMFLRHERILIEIDGVTHSFEKRKKRDIERDAIFSEHGFITIRIRDDELNIYASYLRILRDELKKIDPVGARKSLEGYIADLSKKIDEEIRHYTEIDENIYFDYDDFYHLHMKMTAYKREKKQRESGQKFKLQKKY